MKELEHPTNSVPKGKRFCTVCGEIKRENHFEGDSTHCDTCVHKMMHTRVHAYAVLVALGMLLLCAASVFLGVHTVSFCAQTRRADALAREKLLYASCDAYEAAVSRITDVNASLLLRGDQAEDEQDSSSAPLFFTPGVHTWERYCTVYARSQSDYEAASLIQDSLQADRIEKSAILSGFLEAKEAYDDVYTRVNAIGQDHPYDSVEDMPYDEIMAELDAAAEESDSRYTKGYARMLQGSATQYYRADDPTSALPYYEEALEYLPDESGNIYASIAQIADSAADWDAMREAAEGILERNRDYTDAFEWLSVAAARQGDADAALSAVESLQEVSQDSPLCDRLRVQAYLILGDLKQAKKQRDAACKKWDQKAEALFSQMLADRTLPSADQRILRSYAQLSPYVAIVCLLEDKNEDAMQYAYEKSFNYSYYMDYLLGTNSLSQYSLDIAEICASVCGDDEALDTITQAGETSETVNQVIDGKLSLQDAFLGKEAQLL